MCGKVLRKINRDAVERSLGARVQDPHKLLDHTNLVGEPQSVQPVVSHKEDKLPVVEQTWGMHIADNRSCINARAEKIRTSPLWSKFLDKGRIIIPVSGFYEWTDRWRSKNGKRIPYVFTNEKTPILLLAGLSDGQNFVIITMPANPSVKQVHDRMPMRLSGETARRWLIDDKAPDKIYPDREEYSSYPAQAAS